MKKRNVLRIAPREEVPALPLPATGRLVRVDADGTVWVEWDGSQGPRKARVGRALSRAGLRGFFGENGLEVLLSKGADGEPIVCDLVDDRLGPEPAEAKRTGRAEARVDGKRRVFEASERVELRCGKASITLTKDGRIVVRGAEVTTNATGRNRIRGAAVEIN